MARLIKRAAELASRPWVRGLLADACANPGGRSHRFIQRRARAWYGLDRPGSLGRGAADWFIDFLSQAQADGRGAETDRDLGTAPLGFDDLRIRCRSGDANSSVVYLYGFSDNLAYFDLYRRFAAAGTAAVDVGANLGLHSLVMSRCVGPSGRVLAYEPSGAIARRLRQNLDLNRAANVVPRPCAAGERRETLAFDPRAGEFNIGKGRIDPRGAAAVEVVALDEELSDVGLPVSLVKIDVEGHEPAVLRGARRTLERCRPALVVEINPASYRPGGIAALIPYAARFVRVPRTRWEPLADVRLDELREQQDVLIVPAAVPWPLGP